MRPIEAAAGKSESESAAENRKKNLLNSQRSPHFPRFLVDRLNSDPVEPPFGPKLNKLVAFPRLGVAVSHCLQYLLGTI